MKQDLEPGTKEGVYKKAVEDLIKIHEEHLQRLLNEFTHKMKTFTSDEMIILNNNDALYREPATKICNQFTLQFKKNPSEETTDSIICKIMSSECKQRSYYTCKNFVLGYSALLGKDNKKTNISEEKSLFYQLCELKKMQLLRQKAEANKRLLEILYDKQSGDLDKLLAYDYCLNAKSEDEDATTADILGKHRNGDWNAMHYVIAAILFPFTAAYSLIRGYSSGFFDVRRSHGEVLVEKGKAIFGKSGAEVERDVDSDDDEGADPSVFSKPYRKKL